MLRGVWLLRHPELVRYLGDVRVSILTLDSVRKSCSGAQLDQDVLVLGWPRGQLRLGNRVRVEKGSILALGDDLNGYGRLEVGEMTWIGQYNNLRVSADSYIAIGSRCLISQFCTIVSSNHRMERGVPIQQAPSDPRKLSVQVGDDVWLGSGCAIMPAVSIGTGAVVGANSVVTRSIPEYEIWAGAPASKIGERQ
jgi:acetyltransferase-like isoleucine patch superfamily enzyme